MYKQKSKRALLLFHDLRVTRLVVKKIAILHVKDQHMYVRTYYVGLRYFCAIIQQSIYDKEA